MLAFILEKLWNMIIASAASWPEFFGICAMCCLLIGMTGSRKFMGYAGTCVLLAFVGTLISSAL